LLINKVSHQGYERHIVISSMACIHLQHLEINSYTVIHTMRIKHTRGVREKGAGANLFT